MARLERSCEQHIRTRRVAEGVELADVGVSGLGFSPHRHDTYAIGITVSGVQAFEYRGEARCSGPGQCFVLHPDERHDGRPGNESPLEYRAVYIDPALISEALGSAALPFVADPVLDEPALRREVNAAFERPGDHDELDAVALVSGVAAALARRSSASREIRFDIAAVARVRERLAMDDRVSIAELERLAGASRWQLARQFRAAYGVSVHRFRVFRRLDRARALLSSGAGLADAALVAGFADQAHFARHFRRAYGLPPGAWRLLTGQRPRQGSGPCSRPPATAVGVEEKARRPFRSDGPV
jgi:AraC-like DNA-binding protein